MRKLLHNGFSYKKPCIIGAKADYLKQKEFIEQFNEFSQNIDINQEAILFMDVSHPQHNTIKQYGWILKGQETKFIKSNTKRTRVNIHSNY